jgi:cob(I)alamin adenosyltransferase
MKIYTRTGDDGSTGLYGGGRVPKNDLRVEAMGAVDEFNAQLGVTRTLGLPDNYDSILELLQNQMLDLGAEIATPDAVERGTDFLQPKHVEQIEKWIDHFDAGLAPLQNFILPGGTPAAAALHLARCIARRAERHMVALAIVGQLRPLCVTYMNRVSDLLFVLARSINADGGHPDVAWQKMT